MQAVGPIAYTQAEIDFAQQINDGFPGSNADHIENLIDHFRPPAEYAAILDQYRDSPLLGTNFPALDADVISTGSTDVGDVSMIAPVSMLVTTCFTTGSPGHSWGNVASAGMSIGHKGMLHAAKIMAATAAELVADPTHLVKIRQEFERKMKDKAYVAAIPEGVKPPRYDG
jgi:aminobenzoyl-glutamate utilization protein B